MKSYLDDGQDFDVELYYDQEWVHVAVRSM